jgi:WD40 repeat protein
MKKTALFSHDAAVNAFTISHDDKYLFSTDNIGFLYTWSIKTCRLLKKIEYDNMLIRSIDNGIKKDEIIICYSGRGKASKSYIDVLNYKDWVTAQPTSKLEEISYKIVKVVSRISCSDSKFTKAQIINWTEDFSKDNKDIQMMNTNLENDESLENTKSTITTSDKEETHLIKNTIRTSREDGKIEVYNDQLQLVFEMKLHTEAITDFDYNNASNLLLTVSKDGKALTTDTRSQIVMNEFVATAPKRALNVCKMIPDIQNICQRDTEQSNSKFHVFFAGGAESQNVALTKEGGFEIVLFNLLEDSQVGKIEGHFGPVNCIAVSQNGKSIVSGGEDSMIRVWGVNEI